MKAKGTELAYVGQGQGQPVVLVHGAVSDYRIWTNQMVDFAKHYRVIAYSYRHHYPNARANASSEYNYSRHAADLVALMQVLNLGPAHLVGHSGGGVVTALVARDHPELVRSQILAEPALFSLMAQRPEAKALSAGREAAWGPIQAELKAGRDDEAVKKFLDYVLAPGGFNGLSTADRAVVLDNASTLSLMFKGGPAPFTCEHARKIQAPTLLVEGDLSPRMFAVTLDELQKCLPKAERATLARTSHGLEFENPKAFNEAVLRFLAKQ